MPAIRFPSPIIHTKEIIVLLYTHSQNALACLGITTNDNSGARVFVHRGPLDGVTQKYREGWLSWEIEGMPGNLWPRGVNKRSDPTASFVPTCKRGSSGGRALLRAQKPGVSAHCPQEKGKILGAPHLQFSGCPILP